MIEYDRVNQWLVLQRESLVEVYFYGIAREYFPGNNYHPPHRVMKEDMEREYLGVVFYQFAELVGNLRFLKVPIVLEKVDLFENVKHRSGVWWKGV